MADQGKWFKLWCSAIHDQELQNLELEDWARWAMLGAYIKANGKDGKITFSHPYRALLNLFRVPTIEAAKLVLNRLPNCGVGEREVTVSTETNTTVSLEVEYKNWFKYQGDFSSDRVRRFRDKKRHDETAQEERRRDEKRREETRRETTTPQTPQGGSCPYLKFLEAYNHNCGNLPKAEKLTSKRRTQIAQRWREHPDLAYWCSVASRLARSDFAVNGNWAGFDWVVANDNNHVKVMEGKYDNREVKNAPDGRPSPISYAALARAKREAEKVRENVTPVPAGVGDLPDVQAQTHGGYRNGHGNPGALVQALGSKSALESEQDRGESP